MDLVLCHGLANQIALQQFWIGIAGEELLDLGELGGVLVGNPTENVQVSISCHD
jgi:hypothetical protein